MYSRLLQYFLLICYGPFSGQNSKLFVLVVAADEMISMELQYGQPGGSFISTIVKLHNAEHQGTSTNPASTGVMNQSQ